MRTKWLASCLVALCVGAACAAELPGDSIYQLEIPLQTADRIGLVFLFIFLEAICFRLNFVAIA